MALRVLLGAYACWPGQGSEPASGWGWARSLAEAGHDVTVLVHPRGRDQRERDLARCPEARLRVDEVHLPSPANALQQRAGGVWAARALAYLEWMRAAVRRARRLHAGEAFDVAHHVSFGSLTAGSPLAYLDVPFIFGPVGSGQRAPVASKPLFGTDWRGERLRGVTVGATARGLNPLARRTVTRSSIVLATNDETADAARALGARRVELMSDTGITQEPGRMARPVRTGRRRVAWVGSFQPRKGLPLALDAMAAVASRVDAELHIAGDGPQVGELRRWAAERRLTDRIVYHGRLPWGDVQDLYRSCDAFLFTSVRESLGSQVVEAAAAGLPIVAVDLHGVRALVPDEAAVKVPFTTVDATASRLADGLVDVLTDDRRGASMSAASLRYARSEYWPRRAERVSELYRQAIGSEKTARRNT